VVWDCYLVFVGAPDGLELMEWEDYVGPPLEERYHCTKGCTAQTVGSVWEAEARTMRLHAPYEEGEVLAVDVVEDPDAPVAPRDGEHEAIPGDGEADV
jgi:hypothetical protein